MKFHALLLICQFNANQCVVNEHENSPFVTKEECEQIMKESQPNFANVIPHVKVFTASCVELKDGYNLEENVKELKQILLNQSKGDPT